MVPLTLIAMTFLILAPVFWLVAEFPPGEQIPRGYENAALYQHTYPAFAYAWGRLQQGDLPLWSPEQQCGIPLQNDPRIGLFQPLNLVFLVAAPARALALQAFLCLFIAGATFALYARSLGMRYIPAVLGAMVFAFSGAAASLMSQPALAATFAWAPLFIWAVRDQILHARLRARVIGGLACAALILGGAWGPATVLILTVALYALSLLFFATRRGKAGTTARLRGALAILGVALLIAAVQLLPTLRWALALENPAAFLFGADSAGQPPTGVWELLAQVVGARAPSPLRDALPGMLAPAPAYVGMLPLLVLPAAWFHHGARAERIFCTLCLVAVLFLHIIGALTPDAGNLLNLLYLPATFCLATLCALGSDRLLETSRDPRSPLVWIPVILLVLAACLGLYAAPTTGRGLILLNLLVLFPFIVMRLRWLAAPTGIAVAVLLFVDLATANANYFQHPYENAPETYTRDLDLLAKAGEQALGDRVLMDVHPLHPHLTGNAGLLTGLKGARGAMIPETKNAARWWQAAKSTSQMTRLAAVRLILETNYGARDEAHAPTVKITPPRPEDLRIVYEDGRARLLADDRALRRAAWVPGYEVVNNFDAVLARIQEEDFDPAQTVILEGGDRVADMIARRVTADSATTTPATCALTRDEPHHVRLRVRADQPGLCLLNDTYAPGWVARVDGKRAAIYRANGLFRAVALEAGEHTIDFYYRPWTFYAGAFLSAVGVLGLLAYTLWRLVRPAQHDTTKRRKRNPAR
jgi:hypothetical protein